MGPSTDNPRTDDVQTVRTWYQSQFRQFGYDFRSLGYNHRESQQLRFAALAQMANLHQKSLLDVGCGFGDLLEYLRNQGISPAYTGIDLCPELVEQARARFAKDTPAARFDVADVLSYDVPKQYDYVVASGIFGLHTPDAEARIQASLQKLFAWCREGLAVNFLSRRYPRQAPRSLYVDPSRVLNLALDLTPAVRLHHDYLPNDFTVYLYRTPAWTQTPVHSIET